MPVLYSSLSGSSKLTSTAYSQCLLRAVAVELLEMLLVALVVRGLFFLVLHLEHDRDDLVAIGIELAEYVVALGALDVGCVLLEVRVLEGRRAELVELDLAVLLERLAEHLGVEAGAHVAHALYLAFAVCDDRVLDLELFLEFGLVRNNQARVLGLLLLEARLELVALALDLDLRVFEMVRGLGDGELRLCLKGARLLLELLLQSGDGLLTLGDVVPQPALRILPGKFCRGVALGDLCRELDDARIARRELRLHLAFGLCLDELCGLALLLVELLGKLGVAHLACRSPHNPPRPFERRCGIWDIRFRSWR